MVSGSVCAPCRSARVPSAVRVRRWSARPAARPRPHACTLGTGRCRWLIAAQVVTHPFIARFADELSLETGEVVEVLQSPDGGWSEGRMEERTGWFPNNHVSLITPLVRVCR